MARTKLTTTQVYSPVKFLVYYNGTNALSGTSKVPLNTVVFDTGSNFNTTLNRFVAPVTGYYAFFGASSYNGSVTRAFLSLNKNGTEIIRGVDGTFSAQYGDALSAFLPLVANDYIEMATSLISGTGTYNNAPTYSNSLAGYLISTT